MSHRASSYALEVLQEDRNLPPGARAVLFALAARANIRSSKTYTGGWLARTTGMDRANVSRHIARLEAAGYVSVQHRDGRSSIVGFPVLGFVAQADETQPPPTGRRDEQGQFHPSFCGCPWCLEQTG